MQRPTSHKPPDDAQFRARRVDRLELTPRLLNDGKASAIYRAWPALD
jgi:hypothetical protein